jgi:nucleoside-diphosphate-sugar epimerase
MDVRDAWREDFDVDCIVHLAGLSNDPMADLDGGLTCDINYVGTVSLIGVNESKRHVIASSCSVYGTAEMADETTPTQPLSEYAKGKAAVDRYAAAQEAVSLRFGTLYGWSPGHRLDLVVNRMCYDAVHGRGVTVYGNAARPLTHVIDAARAIVLAVENTRTQGIYNVVGENWRMQDLGRAVAAQSGATLTFKPGGADARDYSASGAKLRATGWSPQHTVASTLPSLLIQSFGLLALKPYVRLETLKSLSLTPDLRRAA